MYLSNKLPKARVLITVKTYPLPSSTYGELVCTAGLLNGEKWIRIYPIPYRALPYEKQYPKYNWLELDLTRNTKDSRPETYRPENEKLELTGGVGTTDNWAARKQYVFKEVFISMSELIARAKSTESKSLGTLKPAEVIDFVIEDDERDWKKDWLEQLKQLSLFDVDESGQGKERRVIKKLPYKFSYKFLSEGDTNPRQVMVEDWEVGALFWNCLRKTGGDEEEAKQLVRQKYFDEFVAKRDLHFFMGTTLKYHNVAPNPFVIIGVFYPPKTSQIPLFS